ncbi:50S ribosomal protein L29 [uncultured Fluviicola sp.]|jgi:large subunit ribosomal protein L29|uniref:50S ribosomal protein L29 n=1 Tax=uncultured Fluviicola sp. TaxID=463303 RepID=UPI0025EDD35B|nr:50S ribosomal protein L29 [uncultured Fluviicola sp.]
MKKKEDLSKLSVEDLQKQIASATEAQAKLKLGHKVTPLENPIVIRNNRKAIARLNTELTKRQNQA